MAVNNDFVVKNGIQVGANSTFYKDVNILGDLYVSSNNLVSNLNSEFLGGYKSTYFTVNTRNELITGQWTFNQEIVGTANSSNKLSTPRWFNFSGDVVGSGSFDGTSNNNITLTIQPDSVALGTDTTGNYVKEVKVSGTGLSVANTGVEGGDFTITSNANSANGSSTIVARDATGDFSARRITLGAATGTAPFVVSSNTVVSNLNADLLDGWHASSIINADGNYIINDTRAVDTPTDLGERGVKFEFKTNTTDGLADGGNYHVVQTIQSWADSSGGNTHQLAFTVNGNMHHRSAAVNAVSWGTWNKLWSSGNDGPGSGLDADLLDGYNSTDFARYGDTTTDNTKGLLRVNLPYQAFGNNTGQVNTLQIFQANANFDAFQTFHVSGDYAVHFGLDGTTNDLFVGGWSKGNIKYKIWHAANHGTGSGLDADSVDGYQASQLAVLAENETVSGSWNFTNNLTVSASSAGDLVRITQTGTGNALVVEDSSNPDSTPFVVTANGRVGIGATPPVFMLDVKEELALSNTAGSTANVAQFSCTNGGNLNQLRVYQKRNVEGTAWDSATIFLQQRVDSSDMGYIAFSPNNSSWGLSFGSRNIERMRLEDTAIQLYPGNITSNFYLANTSGSNPSINFDSSDYLWYDRTNNHYNFIIGGTNRLNFSASRAEFQSEISSNTTAAGGQFRAVTGNFGVMLRNDGSNFYLLQTANGTPYSTWNSYRPFSWNLNTGDVSIATDNKATFFGGNIRISDNYNVYVGTGNDLYLIHDGVNSSITNQTGQLSIRTTTTSPVVISANLNSGSNIEIYDNDIYVDATTTYFRSKGTTPYGQFSSTGVYAENSTDWPVRSLSKSSTLTARGGMLQQRSNNGAVILSGNELGGLSVGGFNGSVYTSGWNGGAEIKITATENWTTANNGTKFSIWTSNNLSATPKERYLIDGDAKHYFSGNFCKFILNNFDDRYAGISIEHDSDSSVSTKTSFIDFLNNLAIADSHIFGNHYTDGSSDLLFGTTPAGSRSSDRRSTVLTLNTTRSINYPIFRSVGGIESSDSVKPFYEINLDWGADVAGTWRKIASLSLANTTYSTYGVVVEVIDPQANHATQLSATNAIKETYYVACERADNVVLDNPDACYVSGPSNRVRAVKTSLGNYEIQIQNLFQYRENRIRIYCYAQNNNDNAITFFNGSTAGSTGTAQYNASVSACIDNFQQVRANTVECYVAQGTAPLKVNSNTLITNLNADFLDGYQVGTTGSAIPVLSVENNWSGRQNFLSVQNWFGATTSNTNPNSAIEIGCAPNYPYIDFHTSNTIIDYQARISCSGTTSGVAAGTLSFESATASFTGNISAPRLISTIATGTAPFTVTSTTAVTNLNADLLDGKHVGTSGSAIPVLDGTNTWTSQQIYQGSIPSTTTQQIIIKSSAANSINFIASANAAAYNPIVQAGDSLIFFTGTASNTGALVIAPWSTPASGIRLSVGNTTITGNVIATKFIGDGSGLTNIASSISVTNDNSTNATYYPVLEDISTGTMSTVKVANTKLTFNPSTGTLSATIFNSLSDEKLKTDVKSVDNGLDIIKQINPVSYNWKENGLKGYGVIAQEIEKILPDLVQQTGEYKSVSYEYLFAFLISAVKELAAKVEENKRPSS